MRPRAYQAHVPFQDIPQLRQLVQAVLAQKPAEPRDTRIIGHLEKGTSALTEMEKPLAQKAGARNHRPKLVASQGSAYFHHTQGSIDDRASRFEFHCNG